MIEPTAQRIHASRVGCRYRYRLACALVVIRPRALNVIGGSKRQETQADWWESTHPLTPGREYVPVAANLSDLRERLAYLQAHPEEARAISQAAAAYVRRALSADAAACYWKALAVELGSRYGARRRESVGAMPASCRHLVGILASHN